LGIYHNQLIIQHTINEENMSLLGEWLHSYIDWLDERLRTFVVKEQRRSLTDDFNGRTCTSDSVIKKTNLVSNVRFFYCTARRAASDSGPKKESKQGPILT